MFPPPLVKLEEVTNRLRDTQKRVEVLWQEPESLAFVARGRDYRSEFHINDSDEFTYMIKMRGVHSLDRQSRPKSSECLS